MRRKRASYGTRGECRVCVRPFGAPTSLIDRRCRAQVLHYTTLKDVNIHQVVCLTLMAAFQASVNAMPMSWLLAGQALRLAQDQGLHVSIAAMHRSPGVFESNARVRRREQCRG